MNIERTGVPKHGVRVLRRRWLPLGAVGTSGQALNID